MAIHGFTMAVNGLYGWVIMIVNGDHVNHSNIITCMIVLINESKHSHVSP